MTLTKDDFFIISQELWETEGNATQLNEDVNMFYYRVYCKIMRGRRNGRI